VDRGYFTLFIGVVVRNWLGKWLVITICQCNRDNQFDRSMYIAQTSQKIVRIYAPWVEWKKVLIRLFELNLMGSKLNPIYFFFAFHFKDNITHATLATSKWNKWHDGAREVVLRWQIIKNFPFQGALDLFIPREVFTWQIRGHLICSSQGRFWRDRSWAIWFLQEWFDQAQLHSMSVKDQARQAKLNYRWWRYMLLNEVWIKTLDADLNQVKQLPY